MIRRLFRRLFGAKKPVSLAASVTPPRVPQKLDEHPSRRGPMVVHGAATGRLPAPSAARSGPSSYVPTPVQSTDNGMTTGMMVGLMMGTSNGHPAPSVPASCPAPASEPSSYSSPSSWDSGSYSGGSSSYDGGGSCSVDSGSF